MVPGLSNTGGSEPETCDRGTCADGELWNPWTRRCQLIQLLRLPRNSSNSRLAAQALQRIAAIDASIAEEELDLAAQNVADPEVKRQREKLLLREHLACSGFVQQHHPIEGIVAQALERPSTSPRVDSTMTRTSSMSERSIPSSTSDSSRLRATASKCTSLSPFCFTRSACAVFRSRPL